ncbi:hypothetical protein BH10PSE13_BH10PSE13_21180 [soil metagenome]
MRRRAEHRLLALLAAIGLSLSACGKAPTPDEGPHETAEQATSDAAAALEALATERGVIGETYSEDPIGSYGRTYDGGEDRLCLAGGANSGDATYRAGVEIRIGEEEYCRGVGTARRSGDQLILSLANGRCTISARYEGDRLVMPGVVDSACASLCSMRGSLAGVTFPRLSADARVNASDGKPLCEE